MRAHFASSQSQLKHTAYLFGSEKTSLNEKKLSRIIIGPAILKSI